MGDQRWEGGRVGAYQLLAFTVSPFACKPNLHRYVPDQRSWFLSFLCVNMGHRCRHFAQKVFDLKLKREQKK